MWAGWDIKNSILPHPRHYILTIISIENLYDPIFRHILLFYQILVFFWGWEKTFGQIKIRSRQNRGILDDQIFTSKKVFLSGNLILNLEKAKICFLTEKFADPVLWKTHKLSYNL